MKPKRLTDCKLKEIYETAIQCTDRKTVSVIMKDFAQKNNVSYRYLRRTLSTWCNNNSMKNVDEYIFDSLIKEVSDVISRNPENLQKCFKTYVARKYPELNTERTKNEFDAKVKQISNLWYSKGRKNHVCFMTVSSKGKALVNSKTTTKTNSEYTQGFFRQLKMRIITLFKHTF